MSKIHQLSDDVCNKIAAGEVVERPASIVKELIENSLDAGAGKIVITIENGGRRSVCVIDDGEGMDQDDALLCLDAHATSKISKEEDIFAITSFGFRGEAVPSIAAVAKMTILTRQRNNAEGTEVIVNGGSVLDVRPAGCPPGTQITVRDLFFNLPARRAFLKTASTEERHIVEIVMNISLAHPGVAFQLKSDNRILLSSPSYDSLMPRIHEFFGRSFAEAMLPVSRTENCITINGFIARRNFTRQSRADQRIFINGRPVEAQAVYRAIREGCGPMLEKGRFLPAILFLTMPPGSVDVNVHPTKREVRFRNEFDVIEAVRSAVSAALRMNDQVIPQSRESVSNPADVSHRLFPDFMPDAPADLSVRQTADEAPDVPCDTSLQSSSCRPAPPTENSLESLWESAHVFYRVLGPAMQNPLGAPLSVQSAANAAQTASSGTIPQPLPGIPDEQTSPSPAPSPEDAPAFHLVGEDSPVTDFGGNGLRLLGVLENSYIVASIPGGLVLIDQHAAHERVLFEKIINGIDGTLSQKLLIPITLELSPADLTYVSRNLREFESIGFEIEPFGKNTIMLNAIPAAIPQENVGGFFQDMLSRIGEVGAGQRLDTAILARTACKAAIKAHDKLTNAQAAALIEQMSHCALPYSCPHGRPTILNISMSEIERRFGRK